MSLKLIKALSLGFLGLVFCMALSGLWFKYWLDTPLAINQEKVITINPGDTLGKVTYQLVRERLLDYPKLFLGYARLSGQTRLEVGEYKIKPNITPGQLLQHFQSGEVVSYRITLVEGLNFRDYLQILSDQEKLLNNLKSQKFADIKQQLGLTIDHPEGWFYPDTYQYVNGTTVGDLLIQAHNRMKQILAEEWRGRSSGLPYESSYEALVMASIVEKETGVTYERQQIAGVFVRRLQKGMRLQADPTIIYGLGDQFKGNIRRKHLKQPTPYNTYLIPGLPPTPIAMPGREALHAALNPDNSKNLYFVARGDGSHHFSETYAEHRRSVKEYQVNNRKQNYRSSPTQP